MSWAGVRVGVGTRVMFDGEIHQITEWLPATAGTEVVLTGPTIGMPDVVGGSAQQRPGQTDPRGTGPEADDETDPAAVALLGLSDPRDGSRSASRPPRSGSC